MKPVYQRARRRRATLSGRQMQPLAIERLEDRFVLDGGLATLVNDIFDAGQNSPPAALDVLANDLFDGQYAGARRITSVSFGSEGGSIAIAADGKSLQYAPPADFFGLETFVYVVDDELTAQVQVRVQAPLAFDSYSIPPDGGQRTLDVLANDPFWTGYAGAREITAVSVASAGGAVVVAADRRSILYTPPEGAYGADEFIYVVDGIYPARVSVAIPETLRADQVETVQHTPATFQVLANDPFWPGYSGDRRITHILDVDEGAVATISSDGRAIIYTPSPDAAWGDALRYVVDGAYETSVNVAIHRPVRDDWFEIDENSTYQSFNVVANDTYRDLSNTVRDVVDRVTSVTSSDAGGTVTVSADGQSVVYTPPAGFSGTDEFTYTADGVHEATVYVQVNRPVRDDYIYQGVYQDTPDAILNVLANDFLGNGYQGPRRITAVGATEQGGAVSIAGGGQWLVYTPAAGYVGQDSFTYAVDGQLEARVTLSVQALAQYDWYHVEADPAHGPYVLDVLSNDYFGRGYAGAGVITAVSSVEGSGQVQIVGGKTLRLTVGPTGTAAFSYTVDGQYVANVSFSLRNRLASDAVVVDQNSASQTLDVLANDFQPIYPYVDYIGPRIITAVGPTRQGGVVSISPDGKSVAYQPPADFYGDDSFTYSVDGIMQSTVQVQVIRRVRDDQFRIEAGAGATRLPVLVNDLFGADYQGPQRITAASAPAAGGTATIAPDGRSILYTPATGFSGVDTFSYAVDGRLKAEVQVVVGLASAGQFTTFGGTEDYQQFLIDDALARYAQLFGKPAWGGWATDGLEGGPVFSGTAPNTRDHSETNVQVAGVDEGDVIEFDSDYAYVLTDGELVIVDAWPAVSLAVTSRVDVEGRPIAEFLHGDRLTVISETGGYLPWDAIDMTTGGGLTGDALFPRWQPFMPFTTLVTVIDVADRSAPQVVQTTSMEGRYVDSRAVADYVYVLVNNDAAVAPQPQIIPDDSDAAGSGQPTFTRGVYETQDQYLARVTANPGELIDAALPNYTAYGPGGAVVRTGLLNEPENVYQPLVDGARNLVSVVSFDVTASDPGPAATAAVYATGASVLYASLKGFYVVDRDYSPEDGATTRIMKFDWDPASGGIDFAAAGAVAGSILNQFSVDEYDGYVRIAVTIDNRGAGNWSNRAENALFVLQQDGGMLEFVGGLQNLALDESMQSIRFMGDRAFLTTFRTVDPLFAVDLSDPASPRALGHLTLPGFASYMQFIDESHLLAVGQNTPAGASGPTQVALYDVSDLTQPRRIDEYTFERFSTSEAQIDHHAFGYFAAHGLLAIPTSRTYIQRIDVDGDGYRETRQSVREDELAVLSIDADAGGAAIALAGEIPHDTAVRRSGYIDDYLYSISGDAVKVVQVTSPAVVLAEVDVAPPVEPPDGIDPVGSPESPRFPAVVDPSLRDAIARAQTHLAGVLQAPAGTSLLLVAEAAGAAASGGYRLVLRAGDDHYLYYVRGSEPVLLANAAYAFPAAVSGTAWHAIGNASQSAGDNTLDGSASGADLGVWQAAYGFDAAADSNGDDLSDGIDFLAWQRAAAPAVAAQVAAATAADFDADGACEGADFLSWQRGSALPAGAASTASGDADGDRDVDAADLDRWMDGYGGRAALAAAALVFSNESIADSFARFDRLPQQVSGDALAAAMAPRSDSAGALAVRALQASAVERSYGQRPAWRSSPRPALRTSPGVGPSEDASPATAAMHAHAEVADSGCIQPDVNVRLDGGI